MIDLAMRDLRVPGEARRLEARVRELVDQELQRHAVLQRQRGRGGEAVHQAGDGRAFLGHGDEDLARRAVLVHADGDVALVAADRELVRDRLALVGQLAAHARCGADAELPRAWLLSFAGRERLASACSRRGRRRPP